MYLLVYLKVYTESNPRRSSVEILFLNSCLSKKSYNRVLCTHFSLFIFNTIKRTWRSDDTFPVWTEVDSLLGNPFLHVSDRHSLVLRYTLDHFGIPYTIPWSSKTMSYLHYVCLFIILDVVVSRQSYFTYVRIFGVNETYIIENNTTRT